MTRKQTDTVKLGIIYNEGLNEYYGTVEVTMKWLPNLIERVIDGQKPKYIEDILYPKDCYDVFLNIFSNGSNIHVEIDGRDEKLKQKVKDMLMRMTNTIVF